MGPVFFLLMMSWVAANLFSQLTNKSVQSHSNRFISVYMQMRLPQETTFLLNTPSAIDQAKFGKNES